MPDRASLAIPFADKDADVLSALYDSPYLGHVDVFYVSDFPESSDARVCD